MEKTIVRENLMTQEGYTPYCGGISVSCTYPRTEWDGEQFKCPTCSFRTNFPKDFIKRYKEKWGK